MIDRIEALVDAIAHLKGSLSNPDSELYQIRNPLGLPSFSRPGKNEIDDQGRRVFSSSLAGMRACLFDAEIKIKGTSRAGVKADDKLENLLRVYGVTETLGQTQVIKFLKRALKNQEISRQTPLSWFLEKSK
jgi:hypothetical protein